MRQRFRDRIEAGRLLAERLAEDLAAHPGSDPVVLALPRGGVPVAYEVAQALGAPLDVLLVRKLGAPGSSELGIGAVMDGAEPKVVLNEDVIRRVRPSDDYIEAEKTRQLELIERRRKTYRPDRPPVDLAGRTVIVVDDGIATGGTARAALAGLAQSGAARVILAVPVAPALVVESLAALTDRVVCLHAPDRFIAVGHHYSDFEQVPDSDVIDLLNRAAAGAPDARPEEDAHAEDTHAEDGQG